MHHSEHQFHNVTRLEAPPTQRLFQSNGSSFSTRRVLVHDADGISEITLFAKDPEALELLPRKSIEAGLAEMDNDTLDALANAVRAERQSRTPQPAPEDAAPAGVTVAEHLAARYAEIDRHPRDCPGGPVTVTEDQPSDIPPEIYKGVKVTVTDDDGEPPF